MSRSSRKSPARGTGKSRAPSTPESARNLKIGEAAKMVGVAPFVLRFWETQFAFLKPRHTASGHRYYLGQDVETLKAVKRLLHKERFTIEGAKKYIRENGLEAALKGEEPGRRIASQATSAAGADHAGGGKSEAALKRALTEVRRELVNLRAKLD
jgi:DNA-binding transcriptional MerR regulator